jgi:hypothetical protein
MLGHRSKRRAFARLTKEFCTTYGVISVYTAHGVCLAVSSSFHGNNQIIAAAIRERALVACGGRIDSSNFLKNGRPKAHLMFDILHLT